MSSLVDVHTHIYPSTYLSLLRARRKVPYLTGEPLDNPSSTPRLVILPSDDDPSISPSERGRPLHSAFSSVREIISFMDIHEIQISILSLANPWLDFLDPSEGLPWARLVNQELNSLSLSSEGRIFAFGTLPLSAVPSDVCNAIVDARDLHQIKGFIMGTSGLGQGLDDPALDPVFQVLEDKDQMVFLHPHYGLPASVYGPRASESGHILPLSLGFPMETSIAFTRMFLHGTFDRFPRLRMLLAHAGATIPALSGRITSCLEHERRYHDAEGRRVAGPVRSLQDVLRTNVWVDAVAYSSTGVRAVADLVGADRVLFGTDHPFFPPLDSRSTEWESVRSNVNAIRGAFAGDEGKIRGVLCHNATTLFDLPLPQR